MHATPLRNAAFVPEERGQYVLDVLLERNYTAVALTRDRER